MPKSSQQLIEALRRDLQQGLSPSTPELLAVIEAQERRIQELEYTLNSVRQFLVI